MGLLFGIDVGGTKIEGVVLDENTPETPLFRHRIATEAEGGYEHILGRIASLVAEMEHGVGQMTKAVGFGTPGVSDPKTGLMKNCNTVCLNGQPLVGDLGSLLERNVVLANDANCFALAEALMGAGKGAESVFGVILGTGVGGGIVIHGRVVAGTQGIAGEWGHNVLEPRGQQCYCGKRGCVETVLSGPAMERYYSTLSGENRKLSEIVERVKVDPAAAETIKRLTDNFGEAISVVVNILDPEVIVLGGGVGKIDALYDAGVESLGKRVFNDSLSTRVVRPMLGDSAGVFGAAFLTAANG
ncbi:MAG TPA: ROK family protein [Fimbriimonadaceae bacterium]|jgi:predicted NBD/HSP70 family sugar kinase